MANRETNRMIVKEQFSHLEGIVKKGKEAKNAYSQALAGINALSKEYNPDYIAAQKQKAANTYGANSQGLYTSAMDHLEKLKGALLELNDQLDLTDPALKTALDLVKVAGSELSYADVAKINSSFVGNQPALRVLQAAYKAAGIKSDGGLDHMIYDPESAVGVLGQYAQAALVQDGSVFSFGVAVGKIAKLEGVDFPEGNPFPSMVDQPFTGDLTRAAEAMRIAAGLPASQ
jgi:hypothetical protein